MGSPERLSVYVRRLMAEKELTFSDIELRSRKLITGGYVRDILKEKTTNPSVDKLKALARGLGVSDDEIFDVARGVDPKMRGRFGDSFLDELFRKCSELDTRRRAEIDGTLHMLDGYVDQLLSEQLNQVQEKKRA